jgi:hypothetical protein
MRTASAACAALLAATAAAHALGEDVARGSLREGDRVRVTAPSVEPKRLVGQALAVREISLRLKLEDGRELELDREDIRKLEVSRGQRSQVVKGAAIGALAGAAILLGALIATHGVCDEDLGGCEAYGLVAAAGAGSGALLGGLVGLNARADRWETVALGGGRATVSVGPAAGTGVAVRVSIVF